MKRVSILFLTLFLCVPGLFAQTGFKSAMSQVTGSEFSFGPKFGFNWASVSHGYDQAKFSFHLGGVAEMRFNDLYGFQAELIYSRQGDYEKEGGTRYWARLNYLNIPLLAKFYVIDQLSLEVGPQIGFLLNAKYKTKQGSTELKTDMSHTNAVDLSFCGGLNYDLPTGMFISCRYNLGLTRVIEKDYSHDSMRNRVMQVSAGWKF